MSRTKRINLDKLEKKAGTPMFGGELCSYSEPEWKATRDKKKHHKPGKKAKKFLNKGSQPAKLPKDPIDAENLPTPVIKKTHVWDYN